MTSGNKNSIENAKKLIEVLEIKNLSKAEKFEKCETLARMAPEEVLELIEDPSVKEGVSWLKEAHKEGFPTLNDWRNAFARTIKLYFEEVGGVDKLKNWHELEAICDEITEEEMEKTDENLRDIIKCIKQIHERTPKRRLELIEKINSETGG